MVSETVVDFGHFYEYEEKTIKFSELNRTTTLPIIRVISRFTAMGRQDIQDKIDAALFALPKAFTNIKVEGSCKDVSSAIIEKVGEIDITNGIDDIGISIGDFEAKVSIVYRFTEGPHFMARCRTRRGRLPGIRRCRRFKTRWIYKFNFAMGSTINLSVRSEPKIFLISTKCCHVHRSSSDAARSNDDE